MDITSLCLDTNVLIEYLKGRDPGASAVEKAVKELACSITAVTTYELLFGRARGNKDIGLRDILIAAICIEHHIPLLTSNEKHFSRVSGLQMITVTQFLGA